MVTLLFFKIAAGMKAGSGPAQRGTDSEIVEYKPDIK